MATEKKDSGQARNKFRKCINKGCLTASVLCKPEMCPDYTRRGK
jgi:hypothetical protein